MRLAVTCNTILLLPALARHYTTTKSFDTITCTLYHHIAYAFTFCWNRSTYSFRILRGPC